MKNVSFPHVTHKTFKLVSHNGGKLSIIHKLAYLCHFLYVYKRVFHFYIFDFSPILQVYHSVDRISTYYPLSEFCGKLWKKLIFILIIIKS